MKEPSMENENVAQGKNGEFPQTFTTNHGVSCINNNSLSSPVKKNKIELAVRGKRDVIPFVGNPNNLRYNTNQINIKDLIYLKKKNTNYEFIVEVQKTGKNFIGKVINQCKLFDEINNGDIFEFTEECIWGVSDPIPPK